MAVVAVVLLFYDLEDVADVIDFVYLGWPLHASNYEFICFDNLGSDAMGSILGICWWLLEKTIRIGKLYFQIK